MCALVCACALVCVCAQAHGGEDSQRSESKADTGVLNPSLASTCHKNAAARVKLGVNLALMLIKAPTERPGHQGRARPLGPWVNTEWEASRPNPPHSPLEAEGRRPALPRTADSLPSISPLRRPV